MNPDIDLLGDSTRRCMLALLAVEGEVCVCEFVAALDELQPSVSRHLALLRDGAPEVRAQAGDPAAARWQAAFARLGEVLEVAVPDPGAS